MNYSKGKYEPPGSPPWTVGQGEHRISYAELTRIEGTYARGVCSGELQESSEEDKDTERAFELHCLR